MNQSEKVLSALLADAHQAFLDKDWDELKHLCATLAEYTNDLSQKDRDKLVWYHNQTNERLQ